MDTWLTPCLGPDPLRSIQIIHRHSLFEPIVNALPSEVSNTLSDEPLDSKIGLGAATILNLLLDRPDNQNQIPALHPYFLKHLQTDPTTRSRLYLASFLAPYLSITYTTKKNKDLPAVEAVIRDALKLGTQNHYLDGIPCLFDAIPRIRQFMADYSAAPLSNRRSHIGNPGCSFLSFVDAENI